MDNKTEEAPERELTFEVKIKAQPLWVVGASQEMIGDERPVDVINRALLHYFEDYGYDEESLNISVQEAPEFDGIHYYRLEHMITFTLGDKIVKRYHVQPRETDYTDPVHWKVIEDLAPYYKETRV